MPDAYKECPSCALDIDCKAEVCPYCGYEFPQQRTSVKYVAILMALLLAWPVFEALRWLLAQLR